MVAQLEAMHSGKITYTQWEELLALMRFNWLLARAELYGYQ